MPFMSKTQYAKLREVSSQAVDRAVKEGRISLVRQGNRLGVISEDADVQWKANTKPRPEDAVKAITKAVDAITEVEPGESTGDSLNDARLDKERIQAKLLQLKYDELSGKLVDADEVEQTWSEITTKIKNKVLGLASKMKQRHPSMTLDQFKTLDEIAREALEELADESD